MDYRCAMSEGGYRVFFKYSRKDPGTCEEVNNVYNGISAKTVIM